MVSLPAPPVTVSSPRPRFKVSLPAPPETVSLPSNELIVSESCPPMIVSSPVPLVLDVLISIFASDSALKSKFPLLT